MYYVLNLIAALHSRLEGDKDRGATATEYAMLVAFIAIIVATGVGIFGHALSDWFSSLGSKIGLGN